MKIEILKDMTIEGNTEDLSKALDKYIENFNSGNVSTKIGWIEPTYVGKCFGRSTYEDTFEIKSVYKEDDKYYFETDSEEVERRIKNEFYKAGKRVVYDRTKGEIEIISIDLVGTEESYRYNKYKRIKSLSMDWFKDNVVLNLYKCISEGSFYSYPAYYYEVKFNDEIVYFGKNLDWALKDNAVDFFGYIYIPVRILEYRINNKNDGEINDTNIYKFPGHMFTDSFTDNIFNNKVILDTRGKYNIKNKLGEETGILVVDIAGTGERKFVKYRLSDGKVTSGSDNDYTVLFETDVKMPIKDFIELKTTINSLKVDGLMVPKSLDFKDKVNDKSSISKADRLRHMLSRNLAPRQSYCITDTLKYTKLKYPFVNIYDNYITLVDFRDGKSYEGAILVDAYNPDSNYPMIENDTNVYNGKKFIRLLVTTEGKIFYKIDNHKKLGLKYITIKDNNDKTKAFVSDQYNNDVTDKLVLCHSKYSENIVHILVDLETDISVINDIDYSIVKTLMKHNDFVNNALTEFNKFKEGYEDRISYLNMSCEELGKEFDLTEDLYNEFKNIYPYISKIKFY